MWRKPDPRDPQSLLAPVGHCAIMILANVVPRGNSTVEAPRALLLVFVYRLARSPPTVEFWSVRVLWIEHRRRRGTAVCAVKRKTPDNLRPFRWQSCSPLGLLRGFPSGRLRSQRAAEDLVLFFILFIRFFFIYIHFSCSRSSVRPVGFYSFAQQRAGEGVRNFSSQRGWRKATRARTTARRTR